MIQELTINDIVSSNEIQPRVQLDWMTLGEYAANMKAGDVFPPVVVFYDGSTYWLADGFHRIEAAKNYAGLTEFQAEIKQGSKRDARLYALGANKDRGLRLTNADKKNIVAAMLGDAEWAKWADNEIARHCGVSHTTVQNYRHSILQTLQDTKPTHRKTTRNGKTYTMDTAKIGKPKKKNTSPVAFEYEQYLPTYEPAPIEVEDDPEPTPELPVIASDPLVSEIGIHNADAQNIHQLDIAPVHLVITSPPYNVGIEYATHNDDLLTHLPLLKSVWSQCYDVMVDGGRIAVVVPFGIGRNPWVPMACKIMETLNAAGFTLRGQIIWDKGNSGGRTSWGSFRLPSDPSLRDTTEVIIVAHKGSSKLEIPDGVKQRDDKGAYTPWLIDSDYFMELAQDHWNVQPESAQRIGHPAPFPVELVKRLIHFYAFPGAHILDPFAGSGTVGVTAKALGCDATLIEIDKGYCELAKERLNV